MRNSSHNFNNLLKSMNDRFKSSSFPYSFMCHINRKFQDMSGASWWCTWLSYHTRETGFKPWAPTYGGEALQVVTQCCRHLSPYHLSIEVSISIH